MESLGQMVKKKRKEKGIKQLVLARLVGISRQAMSQMERGAIKRPRAKVLAALARTLDIGMVDVLKAAHKDAFGL